MRFTLRPGGEVNLLVALQIRSVRLGCMPFKLNRLLSGPSQDEGASGAHNQVGVSPERPHSVENDLELRVIAMPNRLLGQGTAANSLATYFSTSNNRRGTHRCLGLAPANRPLLTNLLVANVSAICNWVLTDKYLKSRQLNSRCFRSLLVAA
jgi:hypothetical protein